jgi:DNA-binding CsgD family transcriptional regulator
MTQHGNPIADSHSSDWSEGRRRPDDREIAKLSAVRARAIDEAGATIARQLNGPLTALLLYMGEIKQHSHQFAQNPGDRDYLQKVVENALQQTERVCALVKDIGRTSQAPASTPGDTGDWQGRPRPHNENGRALSVMVSPETHHKPLTRREREVLGLISEGYSNKEGAMRMQISPRTFESHRAEAMRKLGARNTADLVRAALLHRID